MFVFVLFVGLVFFALVCFFWLLFCILLVPGSSSQIWLKACFFSAFVPMNLAFLSPMNLALNCIFFPLAVLHEGFVIGVTTFLNFSPSNFDLPNFVGF